MNLCQVLSAAVVGPQVEGIAADVLQPASPVVKVGRVFGQGHGYFKLASGPPGDPPVAADGTQVSTILDIIMLSLLLLTGFLVILCAWSL